MAAGLDLVARKSLERGSETSILISSSQYLASQSRDSVDSDSERQDFWSWRQLKDQFCTKNSEPLFVKYQSRLQHTFFMIALMVNVLSGIVAIMILWLLSEVSPEDLNVVLTVKCTTTASSLVLYVFSYRESWFLGPRARLMAASLVAVTSVASEMATSIAVLVRGQAPGVRFSAYPLLLVSMFMPFPRWYQLGLATACVAAMELSLAGMGYWTAGHISWQQMTADVLQNIAIGLLGLYTRFLIEFTNRKAFLDRRECFENKFHLQYEKEQEERLLLSVLPKHISVQVRDGIRDVIRRLNQDPVPQRPFTELFVEKHRNVSILYADIVNSVALTASLNVSDLIETLNELFGRFDDCAEKNFCLRIKLLGDCYYCVSGVPDKDPLHADHCVQMGLDMIEIIRCFREESRVNVDMRIGVHSGNVLSGLLGLRKWQFDIWSRDVTIASRMEQSGRPGCVHVSRATRDLLQGKYCIEPGNGNVPDEYLEKYNMETFFITAPKRNDHFSKNRTCVSPDKTPTYIRRQSANRLQRRQSAVTEVLTSRRRTVLGFSLLQFRLMLTQVNDFMESAIEGMALSKKDQWFHSEGIQPFLLTFRDSVLEKPFLTQKDPLFRYCLLGVFFASSVLTVIGALVKPRLSYFWVPCSLVFLTCSVSLFCFWISFVWTTIMKSVELPFVKVFQITTESVTIRALIFVVLTVLVSLVALIGMEGCYYSPVFLKYKNNTAEYMEPAACLNPSYFTGLVILALISSSLFLRIHFLLKFLMSGGLVTTYACLVRSRPDVFAKSQLQDWTGIPGWIEHCWCAIVTWLLLHLLDRQVEYIGRLDYLWKRKLCLEQQEASLISIVNKTLLRNILPEHVAKYYLNKESMHLDLDLYHEEYTSVAVMFASIPNYMDFYSESLLNDEGRKCLQVLHEIICDFDKLLYEPQFLKLEKIKTIGSTYMAAAGLQPGRNSSRTSYESFGPKEDPVQNVVVLTKLAVAMMDSLNDLNKNAWQDFKLRIGIAVGPVLAGVVGASKPQYDIWGDTVNIASRMDSTGILGQIQVTEAAAELLQEGNKFECQCRGKIFIKGKGWMTTYLVQIPEETKL